MGGFTRSPFFWLAAGFVLWSLCFIALYALHALGCEWGWAERTLGPTNLHRFSLFTAWAVHLLFLTGLLFLAWKSRKHNVRDALAPFRAAAAIMLTTSALVATIWIGTPLVLLQVCV